MGTLSILARGMTRAMTTAVTEVAVFLTVPSTHGLARCWVLSGIAIHSIDCGGAAAGALQEGLDVKRCQWCRRVSPCTVCCSVLPCAVGCRGLPCVAMCCCVLRRVAAWRGLTLEVLLRDQRSVRSSIRPTKAAVMLGWKIEVGLSSRARAKVRVRARNWG